MITQAICGTVIEAVNDPNEPETILFNGGAGHGVIDRASDAHYLNGKLHD